MAPGWHLYWRNPGGVGLATEVRWHSDGARVGPIAWPTPVPFEDLASGLTSYGYEKEVLLSSPLSWNSGGSDPSTVSAEVDVLICEAECVPAHFELSRVLAPPASAEQEQLERDLFERAAARVPLPPARLGLTVEAQYSRSSIRPGDAFEAALLIHDCDASHSECVAPAAGTDAFFFSDLQVFEALELSGGRQLLPGGQLTGAGGWMLPLRGALSSELEQPLQRLSGVLRFHTTTGEVRALEIDLPFPYALPGAASQELALAQSPPAPVAGPGTLGLLQVLFFAMLGGLIINAMPCVMPVLGIKVCAAAELAQHDPRELRRHGFAYSFGVLSSMAALSAVVLALQAAGTQVGWGFQFQEPLFVAVVTSVVVLFAMNLFGLFEINVSTGSLNDVGAQSTAIARSFFDGLLCVVLATPCTAPFLGTAVGFAFAGGPHVIVAVFLAIGAGLAAPYMLVCLIPGWARFVPKPGNWMLRLRTGLGFLLLATAVWLVWIYGQSAGVDGVIRLLVLLVTLAFGAWLLGWVQSLALPRASLAGAAGLVLFSVGALNLVGVQGPASASESELPSGWAPYDPHAIEQALAQAQPVFVSFSADWCITCKVNEATALADARVEREFARLDFARFRGDWTQRDEAIRQELARHGRAGVPLYLVYDPRKPDEPRVLPEILRVDGLLASLRDATEGLALAAR